MSNHNHLSLVPPLVESGDSDGLLRTGQQLFSTWSPANNFLAIGVTRLNITDEKNSEAGQNEDQDLYFASHDIVPSSERREFITQTAMIFGMFQNLLKAAPKDDPEWFQKETTLRDIRKYAIDYAHWIKEHWIASSKPSMLPEGESGSNSFHYRTLYTCFSLFIVLYLPDPSEDEAPIGDELMEWLNMHFIAPSTEEGDHLSSLENPWEDENFWPYLTRSTLRGLSKATLFFLNVLLRHPSEDLQDVTRSLEPLIDSQPRLQAFSAVRDYANAARRWRDRVKALRIDMERIPEKNRYDDFDNWWIRLSDIVGILEGRPEVLKRVCVELGSDWKEVCAAWGVFVDVHLTRQEVPDVVSHVTDEIPPDPLSVEDMIHSALFAGQFEQALEHASSLDSWLSAHLADIMLPMSFIVSDVDDESGLSVRDYFLLSYADHLRTDPGLWQVTVEYMYTCSEIVKLRADEILLRVPLHIQANDDSLDEQVVTGLLNDINQICRLNERESVRQTVCRVAAQMLVQSKNYGLAVATSISAKDWPGLGHIADCILAEYTSAGPSKFSQYASKIAPFIPNKDDWNMEDSSFTHRLIFAIRYARFHQLCANEDYFDATMELTSIFHEKIAPKSWWAILLYDSIPLLQYDSDLLFRSSDTTELLGKLDEIFARSTQGAGSDYLPVFQQKHKIRSEKDALERLKLVRLVFAKYCARCIGVSWI